VLIPKDVEFEKKGLGGKGTLCVQLLGTERKIRERLLCQNKGRCTAGQRGSDCVESCRAGSRGSGGDRGRERGGLVE